MDLLEQLENKKEELKTLESKMSDQSVVSDPVQLREINETYSRTNEIVGVGLLYEKAFTDLKEAKKTLSETDDEEMKEFAGDEIDTLSEELPKLEQDFLLALLPADPMDKKNIIVEIRAGAGGDESSIFSAELMRMYTIYAENHGWKTEIISANRNEVGGYKEAIFLIKGQNAYSKLKYESGVHRVQRVPETEKQGRVHTSTVTVAIMPEVEEVDVKIDPKDLNIEATTSTGAGGQSVNTTYSAIRITHIPTGLMVYCQEERSQKQNKERALSIIRSRIFAYEQEKARLEREGQRRDQIGTGDRSEKIRTYNFSQDRVTDHRINQNFHNINGILAGDLDEIIDSLKIEEINEKLKDA